MKHGVLHKWDIYGRVYVNNARDYGWSILLYQYYLSAVYYCIHQYCISEYCIHNIHNTIILYILGLLRCLMQLEKVGCMLLNANASVSSQQEHLLYHKQRFLRLVVCWGFASWQHIR